MSVAINAIRRLEAKIEDLTSIITSSRGQSAAPVATPVQPPITNPDIFGHSPVQIAGQAILSPTVHHSPDFARNGHGGAILPVSPPVRDTPKDPPYQDFQVQGQTPLSFSQHGVALWPAVRHVLPPAFMSARDSLPKDFVVELENQRDPLPIDINTPFGAYSPSWLSLLSIEVISGLSDAYFAVFNRIMPVVDKYHWTSTLAHALENEFDYSIETCLLLNVLALGCLAVKAYEEGNFSLPDNRFGGVSDSSHGFERPDWYGFCTEDPPGLMFFNEARRRFGFLMCQNDLQACQFYMLSTHYYAQILRPIDSWTMVNRAASCCMTLLKRDGIDYNTWEGDMMSRVFWSTLMYETILIQELNLPLSVLHEYEPDVPLPKFTAYPLRSPTGVEDSLEDDDAFFNFHFLAQAAHRILLTRVRHSLYFFSDKESFPPPAFVAEMHHQLETWRSNLPPALQFSSHDMPDTSITRRTAPSPAHVIAKAMLKSRYFVAKFHIGRPILYKIMHAPHLATENDYSGVKDCLTSGLYWPATMGLCAQMESAQPIKFGWCCQGFGQVLLFHAVSRSADDKLRSCLPEGWRDWVGVLIALIERCGVQSPALAMDAQLLQML